MLEHHSVGHLSWTLGNIDLTLLEHALLVPWMVSSGKVTLALCLRHLCLNYALLEQCSVDLPWIFGAC